MARYDIINYRPEFRDQVLELQKRLWSPETGINDVYMKWKYETNPYLGAEAICLAFCGGELVGFRGMYGAAWQLNCESTVTVVPCAGDNVVQHQHERNGVSKLVTEGALEILKSLGYEHAFSMSAGIATYFSALKSEWRSAFTLRFLQYETNSASPGKQVWDAFADDESSDANAVARLKESLYVSTRPRPAAMANLIASIAYDGRVRHVRDQEYFAWRFNNPLCRYRFMFLEETELLGYMVLQMRRNRPEDEPDECIHIVDWAAINCDIRSQLFAAAIHVGKNRKLGMWAATLDRALTEELSRLGFKTMDDSCGVPGYWPSILVTPTDKNRAQCNCKIKDRSILMEGNWDLRMLYSDNY